MVYAEGEHNWKTQDKGQGWLCWSESRDSDEELEIVHEEPKHHRGEWEVEETGHASAQRESGSLISQQKSNNTNNNPLADI